MEFLRFGSQIPGAGIGCCAMDIIQGFYVDPDEKYSIQLVDGDGGMPVTNNQGKQLFAGPTYKDIFLQRLRTGTFYNDDMPNHGFLAIVTTEQARSETGKKWLALLKEQGFEFVRAVDNSVYKYGENHSNYLFALFRNLDARAIDQNTPPPSWTSLPDNTKSQQELFDALPKGKFPTEEECREAGAPVYNSGVKGKPLELRKEEKEVKASPWEAASKAAPPPQPQWTTMNTDCTKKVPA